MKLKKISKDAFMDLTSNVLTEARENLQRDGALDMLIFWVTPDGSVFVDGSLTQALIVTERLYEQGLHDEAAAMKASIWQSLRKHLEQQKAIGYILVSEAWYAMPDLPQGSVAFGEEPGQILVPETPLPRFDPKKREIILVNWEWKGPPKNVHSSGLINQFFRREGNKIVLEEIGRNTNPAGGQAQGMLR